MLTECSIRKISADSTKPFRPHYAQLKGDVRGGNGEKAPIVEFDTQPVLLPEFEWNHSPSL